MEHLGSFITNHWALCLAFVIVLILTCINELMAQKRKAKALTPQMLVSMMNNNEVTIVDLRDSESYKAGHIIDSTNAKLEDFEQPKMKSFKNKPVVLVCARGLQSQALAAQIQAKGFKVLTLDGGLTAWQGAELPLVKGKG